MGSFLLESQERVRNSGGKQDISVRATEVLLNIFFSYNRKKYLNDEIIF